MTDTTTIIKNAIFLLGLGAIALTVSQRTANAGSGIRCSGPYQYVKGIGKISTPYCEDRYLARVARSRGMKVSGRAVRLNPHKKQDACDIAGHDIRVSGICSDYRNGSRNR